MYVLVLFAALLAGYFLDGAIKHPRPAAILAAILWPLYALYEFLIAYGVLCDAKCNIRVDVILFWPLLLIVSVIGLRSLDRARLPPAPTPPPDAL
jgi:hypothetical protein